MWYKFAIFVFISTQISSLKLMENKKYTSLIYSVLVSTVFFAQISTGEGKKMDEQGKLDPDKKTIAKQPRELDNQTAIYFNANWSNTSRKLEENTGLFSKELGKRIDETSANFWSFGLGIRTDLKNNFRFSIGLGYLKNGEKYSFVGNDSTFNYTTTYSYISMPLVLDFVYGKKLKFNIGGGLVPQMMMNYNQNQKWTNAQNTEGKFIDKRKGTDQTFNQMILSALINAGVQYKYGKLWSIYIMPEARFQLTNTYSKNAPYSQKAIAMGLNLGLTYQL